MKDGIKIYSINNDIGTKSGESNITWTTFTLFSFNFM